MVFIQSLILVGLSISYFFGQLNRLQIGSIYFPIIDVFIVSLALSNLLNKPKLRNKYFLWFILFTTATLLLHGIPSLTSLAYLLRLSCILSLFIFPPIIDPKMKKLFFIIIIANIIFGLIQYFLWPDLTYFKALGWDDHLHRLVSTYFDPTFTGLIYLMFLIYLFFNKKNLLLIIMTLLAIFLTYSRSTFLSLIICSLFIAFRLQKKKIFAAGLIIVLAAILLLPRLSGEGTKLERTSSVYAKFANLQEGLSVFKSSPLIGNGYNNLATIRQSVSHSSSGYDSSLLTILVTTGIIGFTLFSLGFIKLFNSSNITTQTMLIAIFVHSLFANSLLYPFTLIFLILI